LHGARLYGNPAFDSGASEIRQKASPEIIEQLREAASIIIGDMEHLAIGVGIDAALSAEQGEDSGAGRRRSWR
jgi:hypothetical protein